MPNSFTVFPAIIPGNLTVQGNLTVAGDQVRIGAAAPFVRLGKNANTALQLSYNLGFDRATLDTLADGAQDIILNLQGTAADFERVNPAGSLQLNALQYAIFTDYIAHQHTGTTTEDTIYSKLIPANTLGANGGIRIEFGVQPTTQGAGTTNVRIRLGGSQFTLVAITNNTHPLWITVLLVNQNNASAQLNQNLIADLTTGTLTGSQGGGIVNTTADQTLTITVQNSATTDNQTFGPLIVTQLNSFGPV